MGVLVLDGESNVVPAITGRGGPGFKHPCKCGCLMVGLIGPLQELYISSHPFLAISVSGALVRMVEPSAASWLRGASALLASLEPWASGATKSRGIRLFSDTLADLHAVAAVAVAAVVAG